MPEDYYGDGGDAAPAPGGQPEGADDDTPHDTGTTAVLPSEICPGMKVGDEMVLKIIGVDDDSYEVAYAPKEGKGEEEAPAPAAPPAEGSMASMME